MKAREKETKEREARYSNGHLFTSLSVSATTLCSACNKSITAKEALSCPSESRTQQSSSKSHFLLPSHPTNSYLLLNRSSETLRDEACQTRHVSFVFGAHSEASYSGLVLWFTEGLSKTQKFFEESYTWFGGHRFPPTVREHES